MDSERSLHMSVAIETSSVLNGIDRTALKQLVENVAGDARQGKVKFAVETSWRGGARTETRVDTWDLAGRRYKRDFSIHSDEPRELCGTNTQANPQELLMAAFNACMTVGYVAGATMHGIELESLVIETEGD